ncbi:tetratricopeptide repeat protein [Lactobacillus sp. ESL0791]|uniref:tetratricopeptide repeat protein n=1 Tax=Lactobacillus sp. ESL0791 TaxID=2983234 RepID=UPI0023F8AB77|nr:tetratricopeptide repeat protein [Lactobacillus sp. ESL0791]MDF7638825.1 tetratricopeptide repeat protein [Lactobacillus sp. ESL0791]
MDKKIAELYDAGKTDQAIHLLVKQIDAHPKNAENYLQLATYLLEQGSFDQASKLLEEAKHIVTKPEELDYDLAVCYYMQGDFTKAINLLDQIPNDDLVLYQKALVYLKIGQKQKALAYALSIKEVDDRVKELLGDIWLSLGEMAQAETSFLKIAVAKRTAKINFLLGVCFLTEDRDQAEKFWDKAEKQDPKYYQKAKNEYAAILKMLSDKGKKQ